MLPRSLSLSAFSAPLCISTITSVGDHTVGRFDLLSILLLIGERVLKKNKDGKKKDGKKKT